MPAGPPDTCKQSCASGYALNPDPDTGPDPAFQVNPDTDLTRIQSFKDQKLKKNTVDKLLDQKLRLTYVRATEEAFGPQKITFSTAKNEIY